MFLLAALAVSLLIQRVTLDSAKWSARSERALTRSAHAMAALSEANRDLTTYAAKHNPNDLAAYRRAIRGMPAILLALQHSAQTPAQAQRAAALTDSLSHAVTLLDTFAALESTGKIAAAKALDARPSTQALGLLISRDAAAFDSAQRELAIAHSNALRVIVQRYEVMLITLCLLGIFASVSLAASFGLSTARRLGKLQENAERMGRGERAEPIFGSDEIARLDHVYQSMTRRIQQEHAVASSLQRALLPQDLPAFAGLRIDTAYVPAAQEAQIGGDWYDVFELSRGCIGISIGDVAGHGLHAASVMGAARQAIRTAAHIDANPAAVLAHVNRVACLGTDPTMVTALYGTLDMSTGVLRYAVAGHPLPLLMTVNGEVEQLSGEGIVLGVDPVATYANFTRRVSSGCNLLLYTDGLVEHGRDYFQGFSTLTDAFRTEACRGDVAALIVRRILQGTSSRDDAAVLFIGIEALADGAVPERYEWEFNARDEHASRRVKRALLWRLASVSKKPEIEEAAQIIFGELVSNVARHTPGPARLELEFKNGTVALSMCDFGEPFTTARPAPDLFDESGRGLLIVSSVSQEMHVERVGGGNCVRTTLRA